MSDERYIIIWREDAVYSLTRAGDVRPWTASLDDLAGEYASVLTEPYVLTRGVRYAVPVSVARDEFGLDV
jgi:hypothetical protein